VLVTTQCPKCGLLLTGPNMILGRTIICRQCRGFFVGVQASEVATVDAINTAELTGNGSHSAQTTERAAQTLGRFELKELLGQGSFGKVYRAYDTTLERDVALKIPKLASGHPERIRRFLAEAKASARLRHPNIVAVFDAGQVGDQYFIASEFVTGEPLANHIRANAPSFRQSAQWVRDLALALAYAHEMGIVHRDIKPGNIMIGQGLRPQLMDFGLAKRLAAEEGDRPTLLAEAADVTADGTVMGTPAYMAPEQARGDVKAIGPGSDVYSLGVVLYELLTGRTPFAGTVTEVLAAVAAKEPLPPRQVRKDIPRSLEAICQKAMEKDPARRYASAGELAVDLQLWLKDEPVHARAFSRREQAARWCRQYPKIAVASALASLALIATIAYLSTKLSAVTEKATSMQVDADRVRSADYFARGKSQEGVLWLARAWGQAVRLHDSEREKNCALELMKNASRINGKAQPNFLNLAAGRLLGLSGADFGDKKLMPESGLPAAKLFGIAIDADSPRTCQFAGFRPDGKVLLVRNGKSRLYDASGAQQVGAAAALPAGNNIVRFTPDGHAALCAMTNPPDTFVLRDPATWSTLGPTLSPGVGPVRGMFLSPTGTGLVVVGDRYGKLTDPTTGAGLIPNLGPDWHVRQAAFSLDGKVLVALEGKDQPERFSRWNAATSNALGPGLPLDSNRLARNIALGPDGLILIVRERQIEPHDQIVELWNIETEQVIPTGLPPITWDSGHWLFSPSGRLALTWPKGQAELCDLTTGHRIGEPLGQPISGAAFSRSGGLLLTWQQDEVRLRNPTTAKPHGLPLIHADRVQTATISPDERSVLTVHETGTRLWSNSYTLMSDADRTEAIGLWAQLVTTTELTASEQVRALDDAALKARQARFDAIIGMGPGVPRP